MFKIATRGATFELTMARAPVNAINREWIDGFEAVLDDLARQQEYLGLVDPLVATDLFSRRRSQTDARLLCDR